MSKIDNEIKEGTPRFKKGDAFVGMAPHPLVYMEVNEVEVSQSYTKENGCKTGGKVGGDVVENVTGKDLNDVEKPSDVVENVVKKKKNVVENILVSISEKSNISTKELAAMFSLSERQVQRIMTKLKEQRVIRRIGPDKGGHWEIIAP